MRPSIPKEAFDWIVCLCCGIGVDATDDYCYGCHQYVCQPCAERHRHYEDDAHMVPGIQARWLTLFRHHQAERARRISHAERPPA